ARVAADDRRRAAARPWAVTRRARNPADARATLAWRGDLGRDARADAVQADARGAYRRGWRHRCRPASRDCAAAPAIEIRATSPAPYGAELARHRARHDLRRAAANPADLDQCDNCDGCRFAAVLSQRAAPGERAQPRDHDRP